MDHKLVPYPLKDVAPYVAEDKLLECIINSRLAPDERDAARKAIAENKVLMSLKIKYIFRDHTVERLKGNFSLGYYGIHAMVNDGFFYAQVSGHYVDKDIDLNRPPMMPAFPWELSTPDDLIRYPCGNYKYIGSDLTHCTGVYDERFG